MLHTKVTYINITSQPPFFFLTVLETCLGKVLSWPLYYHEACNCSPCSHTAALWSTCQKPAEQPSTFQRQETLWVALLHSSKCVCSDTHQHVCIDLVIIRGADDDMFTPGLLWWKKNLLLNSSGTKDNYLIKNISMAARGIWYCWRGISYFKR